SFFFYCFREHHDLHSFPTRRSSDLPKIVKVIEAETVTARTGYSRPHTAHCGPDGIYLNALGSPEGEGPGGIFIMDSETFEVRGRDRKSTRLNSSHDQISYAVFCLKK